MDYFTLVRHTAELTKKLADKPLVIKAFDMSGRAFALRLKQKEACNDLLFSLDQPEQGFWLSEHCSEIDKMSSFVRTLNRVLVNARLLSINVLSDNGFDRVVRLHLASVNKYFGNRTDYYMVCEFTGRIANIFICDSEMKVLDQLGHSSNNDIGREYTCLDSSEYADLRTITDDRLKTVLAAPPSEWANYIGGLSPVFVKELESRTDRTESFRELAAAMLDTESKVNVWAFKGKIKNITCFGLSLPDYELKASFDTVNEAADWLFSSVCLPRRMSDLKTRCLAILNRDMSQKTDLYSKQCELLDKYRDFSHYKHTGELLTANLYRIKPGMKSVEVDDWDSGTKVVIALDPLKSASTQAQKYFLQFKKAQRGIAVVEKRITDLKNEMTALKEQIWLTEAAESESDLQLDLLLPALTMRRKHKEPASKGGRRIRADFTPLLEIGECRFYVGKNAKQNDLLTFQFARKGDIWFHANDVPGSHVVLRKLSGEITDSDLLTGAELAAWFSFLKTSSKAAVDYTDIAFVKRIPGGGPGRVNYTNQRTLYVDPQHVSNMI